MYINQNSRLRTVTESKATPNRTILWGSVKLHTMNLPYALFHAKHGSSNATEINSIRPYNCPCIAPYLGQNEFFVFSKACFSKRLERFCSTLLLYTATIVWTSIKPRFSFWNECYRFALNSKFQSAREDQETHERVELLRKK